MPSQPSAHACLKIIAPPPVKPVQGDAIRDTGEKFCERRLAVLQPLRLLMALNARIGSKTGLYWSMRRARVAAIRR